MQTAPSSWAGRRLDFHFIKENASWTRVSLASLQTNVFVLEHRKFLVKAHGAGRLGLVRGPL